MKAMEDEGEEGPDRLMLVLTGDVIVLRAEVSVRIVLLSQDPETSRNRRRPLIAGHDRSSLEGYDQLQGVKGVRRAVDLKLEARMAD